MIFRATGELTATTPLAAFARCSSASDIYACVLLRPAGARYATPSSLSSSHFTLITISSVDRSRLRARLHFHSACCQVYNTSRGRRYLASRIYLRNERREHVKKTPRAGHTLQEQKRYRTTYIYRNTEIYMMAFHSISLLALMISMADGALSPAEHRRVNAFRLRHYTPSALAFTYTYQPKRTAVK